MEDRKVIRVGSRESRLAVEQTMLLVREIERNHPELKLQLVTMKTTGDKILDRSLDQVGGKGLFVKELDKALAEKQVDITVHSLKDMPMEQPEGLPIVAAAVRGEPRDVLVYPKSGKNLGAGLRTALPHRHLQRKAQAPADGPVSRGGIFPASGECAHQAGKAGRGPV